MKQDEPFDSLQQEYVPYCIGNIRQNGVVSTSNKLLRPIELSTNEYKALLYAMSVANYGEKKNQEREITEQTYIYLYKEDLANLLGLNKRNSINVAIDRIYRDLTSRVAHFVVEEPIEGQKGKKKKVHSVVPIIRELRWEDHAKNALQIRFTSEVLPFFTQLASGNFTTYQLKHLFALDSVGSMSLYSFLIKSRYLYADQPMYEIDLSIETLKLLIDLNEKKYDRWVDFKRYVLEKIINDINQNTDIVLSYVPIKKGRPIVGVTFQVMPKSEKNLLKQPSESIEKIYLDVPFVENSHVKELGAKFDSKAKAWFIVSNEVDIQLFQQWFKPLGCLTESQANIVMNDVLFQMEHAESGESMDDFRRRIKVKLMRDQNYVKTVHQSINRIFEMELVAL